MYLCLEEEWTMSTEIRDDNDGTGVPEGVKVPFFRTTALPVGLVVIGLLLGSPWNLLAAAAAAVISWRVISHSVRLRLSPSPSVSTSLLTRNTRRWFIIGCGVIAVAAFFANGSGSALSCSSSEAEDMVGQIYKERQSRIMPDAGRAILKDTGLSFSEVRTTNRNPETGALRCRGQIHANASGDDLKKMGIAFQPDFPAEYSVSKTDDGQLYVEMRRATQ
jgi:hypothetical protein